MSGNAFTVAREALLPALSLAVKAVEKRSTVPVLQNLLIRSEAGKLHLTGTDLDTELSAGTACAGGDALFTVGANVLHDAVRKFPEGAAVTFEPDSQFLTLSAGRARFRLPVLPADDFPAFALGGFSHEFTLAAATLLAMLDTVDFAVSTEEARFYLNGIHFHVEAEEGREDGGRLVAVATDGHRLARLPVTLPEGAAGMPAIILPRRSIGPLRAVLGKEPVSVSLSASKVLFVTETGRLASKLIDGTFPDYQRVIPQGNANIWAADRAALAKVVDRVITISSERGRAMKCVFMGDQLRIEVNSPDNGNAVEELTVEQIAGEPVEIGFNGRYCLDVLSASSVDRVRFELGAPGAPAIVRPDGEPDTDGALFVIMPMRV